MVPGLEPVSLLTSAHTHRAFYYAFQWGASEESECKLPGGRVMSDG